MKITVTILYLLVFACSTKPAPDWVRSQPWEAGYWFGIGMVDKPYYGEDIREAARNNAISEISAQISIEISSSFEQIIEENNMNLESFSKSVIKARAEKDLPEIDILDVFDSDDRYFLLARLSQKAYYESVEKKRRNAINTALGFIAKAEEEFSRESFNHLGNAMREILPYMDVPIEVEYPDGSGNNINLHSYLQLTTTNAMSRLTIIPYQKDIDVKLGFSRGIQLGAKIRDKSNDVPLEGFPISLHYQEEEVNLSVLSDDDGQAVFPIPTLNDKKAIQYVEFQLQLDELFGDTAIFGRMSPIQAQSILKVVPPDIYIQITENILGVETTNPYVAPVIKEFFAQHFSANFIETGEADLIINGAVNSRSVSDKPNTVAGIDVYQTFGDATITVINGETGEEMVTKSFNKIQGSAFQSNQEAANQALKKLSERITEEFLPELSELIQGL